MKKSTTMILALSLLATATVTQAHAWTRYGGDMSCGKVVVQKDNLALNWQVKAWTFGFISAVNDLMQLTYKNPPDEEGIWQAVILYCQSNPLDDHYTATAAVLGEIIKRETK